MHNKITQTFMSNFNLSIFDMKALFGKYRFYSYVKCSVTDLLNIEDMEILNIEHEEHYLYVKRCTTALNYCEKGILAEYNEFAECFADSDGVQTVGGAYLRAYANVIGVNYD